MESKLIVQFKNRTAIQKAKLDGLKELGQLNDGNTNSKKSLLKNLIFGGK